MTTTPANPTSSPTARAGESTDRSPRASAMPAANSGTVATSSPVSPEGSVCSAWPRRRKGPAISTAPNARTHGHTRNAGRSAPRCSAIGNSTAAPSSVRPATIAAGEMESTASLMNRYGMPHSTAMSA